VENIFLLEQTAPLLAIALIVLALSLGIIFYLWSVQNLKKIKLQIIEMKNNVSILEYLSQSIYETAYLKLKGDSLGNNSEIKTISNAGIGLDELKEVQKQIKYIAEKQAEINQILRQKIDDDSKNQKEIYSNKKKTFIPHFPQGQEDKFNKISELIIMNLKNLKQEKEQVTAQELVYAMPGKYSLADIYRTLEIMRERDKIFWEDKSINPQSFLTIL
jgi:hypothetical protein